MSKQTIQPTVGRIVWYWGNPHQDQPQAAIIVYVHSEENVNLVVFDPFGDPDDSGRANCVKYWDGNPDPHEWPCWQWMPYQLGQAARTQELQQQIDDTKETLIKQGMLYREPIDNGDKHP